MKIYLASSWKNQEQPRILHFLRAMGHEVYDFRNPMDMSAGQQMPKGFAWSDVDPDYQNWTVDYYTRVLDQDPVIKQGFANDYNGMVWADCCVLLLPAGPSAHLEAGWFMGQKKPVHIYFSETEKFDKDLMYLLAQFRRPGHPITQLSPKNFIHSDLQALSYWLDREHSWLYPQDGDKI